jgi:hypothetical protein
VLVIGGEYKAVRLSPIFNNDQTTLVSLCPKSIHGHQI